MTHPFEAPASEALFDRASETGDWTDVRRMYVENAAACDAIVGACGRIEDGMLIQAKGFPYSAQELLCDTELAEKYRDFGAQLEFVSDRSSEGNQFVRGFGGIGAILRYKLNFEQLADFDDEDEFYDD